MLLEPQTYPNKREFTFLRAIRMVLIMEALPKMFDRTRIRIPHDRFLVVQDEIRLGSEPGPRFYIMVAVSTLIAGFGLITNSTAVVIGAMLVAPLMTPIFGLAFALITGDAPLLGKSLRAEVVGVAAAVAMAFILGALVPTLEPTQEMLSRTEPNLFDLMVAVFSGFAGSYALVDERISPALPGVAIATAIVPPLANAGLCFSVGAFSGGAGSFLLFLANFLSILLVASATFWVFGMAQSSRELTRPELIKRFGLAVICYMFVASFLGDALYGIIQERQLKSSIESTLTEELSSLPATGMEKVLFKEHEGKLYVLAEVSSPDTFSPRQVKKMEDRLNAKLGKTSELIIRNRMTNDVSAYGSTVQTSAETLDGFFISSKVHPDVSMIRSAERIIRDYLSSQIGLNLHRVELLHLERGPLLTASIYGVRSLSPGEIQHLEQSIQKALDNQNIRFLVHFVGYEMQNRNGVVRYEWTTLSSLPPEQRSDLLKLKGLLENEFNGGEQLFFSNANATVLKGVYHVLLELKGPGKVSKEDVKGLEMKASEQIGKPVNFHVWVQPDYVVSANGIDSYDRATKEFFKKQEPSFSREIVKILDAAQ